MNRCVEDVMTRKVVVVQDSAPFKEIVRLMREYRVSALPVVDDERRLIGIISEADLLLKEEYALGGDESGLFDSRRRRAERTKAAGVVAADIMTMPVFTVGREATLAQAARLMHEKRVKRLPVVDLMGRVQGIVSRADLLKVFLRPDDEIRSEIVNDIVTRTVWIDPTIVRVTVHGGVVQLEGRLEQRSLIEMLMELVRRVDGVVGIENRLSYEIDDVNFRPEVAGPWGFTIPSARAR